jgi:hypothetical protein
MTRFLPGRRAARLPPFDHRQTANDPDDEKHISGAEIEPQEAAFRVVLHADEEPHDEDRAQYQSDDEHVLVDLKNTGFK